MRAYEIREAFGLERLQMVERPEPTAAPGEAVVRVRAVSLNARDLRVAQGLYNPKFPLPLTPCSDMAGVVESVGPGVKSVRRGDRVSANFMTGWLSGALTAEGARTALGGERPGVLAEKVALPAESLVAVPSHLSFEEAAALPCAALTAWHALMEPSPVRPGEVVLVQGTGGVALFALQFAQMAGARVILISSSDEKLARASGLGVWRGINYRATPDWDKEARGLTGGAGVDRVIEVAGRDTLERSLRATRYGGVISLIGMLTGPPAAPLTHAFMKNLRLQGIFVGSREMFQQMLRAIETHQSRPVLDRVFDFEQADEAFRRLASGAHFGKVVIRLGCGE